MIIYPAIDIKDGQCVRLLQGDMDRATIFNNSPVNQAKQFEEAGFKWLHIVDLNGAIDGRPVNKGFVEEIISATSLNIQLGGGIRDLQTVEMWLKAGIKRVILGTAALKNPQIVKEACKLFPNQIAVGIDAKDGMVATHGWVEGSATNVIDLAAQFEDAGVAAIIYTDIGRDGMLEGVDLAGTKNLAQSTAIPIIASGGVSCLDDIARIKEIEEYGVDGAIVGRAIYDKKISLNELSEII